MKIEKKSFNNRKMEWLELRIAKAERLSESAQIGEFCQDQLATELKSGRWTNGWQVFRPDIDIGIDFIAAKNWAIVEIQVTGSTLQGDKRYGFQLRKLEKDPRMFMVFCKVKSLDPPKRTFYTVPTTRMDKIPRFKKAFQTGTFKRSEKYKCNLSTHQVEKILKKYKNEKGFALLESQAEAKSFNEYIDLLKSLTPSSK